MDDADRIYRLQEVRERIGGLSHAWIYKKIAAGEFPPPIRLAPRAVGWRSQDIEIFLASRPVGVGFSSKKPVPVLA